MINGRMMRIAGAKMASGAFALFIAGTTQATTLVGGGATLPAIAYVGGNAAMELQVSPAGTGSLFGALGAFSISYCQTGDDASKDIIAGATVNGVTYNVQNACATNVNGTVTGFGAGLSGVNRTDLKQPNFAASDSPLGASDVTNYQANHGSTEWPTQFPALAGAIAIAFNLKDNTGTQVTSSEVSLSDAQICDIFSGVVTNWSDSGLASAFTLPAGHSIPASPINVQYRSDGSGTTFSLSNHLANVCGTINGHVFETNQAFPSAVAQFFPSGLPSGDGMTTPNWTGSSGDKSLARAIGNTSHSIGYVSTADALATNPPLPIADVNGRSPTANFGSALTITGNALVYNEVISGTNNTNGTAALLAITNSPNTQCIALVPPSSYAVPGSRGSIVPSTSYPIVTISYLLGNTQGNGSDLSATQSLLTAPYLRFRGVTTIGPGTGYAYLTLGTGAFTTSQISSCLIN